MCNPYAFPAAGLDPKSSWCRVLQTHFFFKHPPTSFQRSDYSVGPQAVAWKGCRGSAAEWAVPPPPPEMPPGTAGRARRVSGPAASSNIDLSAFCWGWPCVCVHLVNSQMFTNEDKHWSHLNFHFHLAISLIWLGFVLMLLIKLLHGAAPYQVAGGCQATRRYQAVCLSAPLRLPPSIPVSHIISANRICRLLEEE